MRFSAFYIVSILILIWSYGVISGDDLSCQVLYTYGYGYQQFLHLPESSYNKNGTIIFKFSIKARSDAHILLSPYPAPNSSDAVYEIVLGAGKNTFSDIRRLRRASTRATTPTRNLLSDKIMQPFWVKINNGLISVGKDDSEIPFLSWQDTNPLDIRYISFCTWSNVVGKWSFDCKGTQMVQSQLTKMETLQNDLLSNYDPYAIPISDDNIMNIDALILLNYVNLDAKKLSMELQGTFQFTWFDQKLQWFPSDYENITALHLTHRRVWLPEFILFNAVGDGSSPMGKSTWIVISNEGKVKWTPSVNFETRCNVDLSNWPWDEHKCEVKLGLYANQDTIDINIANNISKLNAQKTGSEWEITSLIVETTLVNVPWQDDLTEEPDETDDRKTALVLNIGLKRKSESYRLILFLPLFVSVAVILSSCWLSLMSFERIFLNCISILLLTMFLLTNDKALPALTKNTPYIILVYSRVLLVATICTTISIFLTYIVRKNHLGMPPKVICKILKSIFIKAFPWFSQEGKYDHLENNDSTNLLDSLELTTKEYWNLLARVLNSIAFTVLLIAIVVVITQNDKN